MTSLTKKLMLSMVTALATCLVAKSDDGVLIAENFDEEALDAHINVSVRVETDDDIYYGEVPSYNGATPTKAADEEGDYAFIGWSPKLATVAGDTVYTAQFVTTAGAMFFCNEK